VDLLFTLDGQRSSSFLGSRGIWWWRWQLSWSRILEEVGLEYFTGNLAVWSRLNGEQSGYIVEGVCRG
jgi:hypothetical protein